MMSGSLAQSKDTGEPPSLPFTFEVYSPSNSNMRPMSITVLHRLKSIIINKIQTPVLQLYGSGDIRRDSSTNISRNQRVFQLSPSTHRMLASLDAASFFVKIQKQVSDKTEHLGLVFHIFDSTYGLTELPSHTKVKDIASDHDSPQTLTNPSSLISAIAYQPRIESTSQTTEKSFSMKPPTTQTKNDLQNSPNSEDDPLHFLIYRYFSILYSLNTPLSYFPKTALTRLANLCNNETDLANTLVKMIWSIDHMDERHQKKYGIIEIINHQVSTKEVPDFESSIKTSLERKAQGEFVSKHRSLLEEYLKSVTKRKENDYNEEPDSLSVKEISSEQRAHTLFMELKIREAQLQILLILQLLKVWNVSEEEYLEKCLKRQRKESEKKNKEAKTSLVRKKRKNRKIVPTLLGMGVNVSEKDQPKVSQNDTVTEYSLFINLDTIIDRMGVWDTLLGRTQGNDNDSAFGFLVYVLVPYYNKRLPMLVKYIIDKVKDSNMKLVTKSVKSDKSKASPGPDTEGTKSEKPRSSKFRKTLLNKKTPTLSKSATFDLSDNLKPAFSLKRSKSNLSSKHLQKRQVEISSVDKVQKEKPSRKSSMIENESDTFIFGKIKKVKLPTRSQSTSQLPPSTSSVWQVEATPSKNRIVDIPINPTTSQVQATPTKTRKVSDILSTAKVAQIEATPQTAKVIESTPQRSSTFEAINTPKDQFIKPSSSFSDKLLSVHNDITPKESITSSPFSSSLRPKPGDPVAIPNSPFYNPSLAGSPLHNSKYKK